MDYGKKPLDEVEKKARVNVLKNLKSQAGKGIAEKIKEKMAGMKKVTVAADSAKGLKEGLEKAEELVESKDMSPFSSEESPEKEMESEEGESEGEHEGMDMEEMCADMSEQELDEQIQKLQKMKQEKMMKV